MKNPKDTSMKILTFLKYHIFRLHKKLKYILNIFKINYQRFCKQWYDQAAQPQNMTYFLNVRYKQKSLLILTIFESIFNFTSLE